MLTDRQMDAALALFQARMQDVTDLYLRRMGEHIRDIGQLTSSDVHRLQQIRRMNRNLRDVKRHLARASGLCLKDLEAVLGEAARTDDRVARKILGVNDADVALQNNEPLRRALRAQYAETAGRLNNLSNTTVARDAYRRAVDAAVTAVQSGAEDYESAIRRTLRQAGSLGLRVRDTGTSAVAYASGHTRRVDSAVRMNVLDAMRRMNQRAMAEVGRQFGADGVEIDAHMLCAEDHLPYQGQQFSNEEFEQIQDSLERPFGEWNCRHMWQPIIMGVSPRAYTDEDLEKFARYSTEEVEIDGRTKTRYEWSQEMRRMETAIREKKDTATLAAAAGDESLRRECQGSVNALVKAYERLSDRTGLGPDFRRTYVAGFKDVSEKAFKMGRPIDQGQWPDGGSKITVKQLDELTEYAAEKGVKLVSFDNFDGDISIVRDYLDNMARIGEDYPEVFTGKRQPELALSFRMSPKDYAETGQHRITLNAHILRDKQFLINDYVSARDEDTGEKLFVIGTEYLGIIHHEMGHMVVNTYNLPAGDIVRKVNFAAVSGYAKKNANEAIAEAFNAKYGGINNPEALQIIQNCDRIIIERRKAHDDERS